MKTVIADYIWLDGNYRFRSKSKTIDFLNNENVLDVNNYTQWSYDGSSCDQAHTENSEIVMKPQAVFSNPFRNFQSVMVLCDTYHINGTPTKSNSRKQASEIFLSNKEQIPLFGLEQEFFLLKKEFNNIVPLGWTNFKEQGQYYCSVGSENAFGRSVVDKAYEYALKSGIKCSGMNAEVAPGQWEIQVGPCEGIEAGDHMCMLRYILQRVGEEFNVIVNLDPKPVKNVNGSGCHVNFSTFKMRNENGYYFIKESINKLGENHKKHMMFYGEDNHLRMSGTCETSSFDNFSFGVGDRSASVRIPFQTFEDKKGYLEDRRPGSNIDPYLVTSKIFETSFT